MSDIRWTTKNPGHWQTGRLFSTDGRWAIAHRDDHADEAPDAFVLYDRDQGHRATYSAHSIRSCKVGAQ